MNDGDSTVTDFVGASVSRTVRMNGHFKFHYDESLKLLAGRGYIVTDWKEL